MTPTLQKSTIGAEDVKTRSPLILTGEEVVITGMSGLFPSSDHVINFKENLYNKVDMVSDQDSRWTYDHPEVPKHFGKISGLGKFDAQFFKVHYKQAWTMEPMSRKLLEHAYGAIYDAGYNPIQFRGKKVGVFVGSSYSDTDKSVLFEQVQRNGLGITGCCKSMFANRISYWLDAKGPSYSLDLACASSTACLEQAFKSISTGQCDSAIVGGCCIALHPTVVLNLYRAGFLCMDGKTKCFDKNGDGYVRSDTVSALFLQKAKNAKRIYAEVYYAKSSYSLKADCEFLPIRQAKDIKNFLDGFYSDINVSTDEIEYIEACGSGIAEADNNELEAIGQVFAKNRIIKVGSVKSNMGNSESASGNCAVTKVCLAYQEGLLPPNLHYGEPQDHIPSVRDGKIKVVAETVPFGRGYAALNTFSFSGANIHVLLKGHYKALDSKKYSTSVPYLVLASGRHDFGASKILNALEKQPINAEEIGLLHSIHSQNIPGHMCRGYTVLAKDENNKTISLSKNVEYYPGLARPVWFVYSGMGSQWAGMGAELMRIPTFAAAIERCHKVLSSKGINVIQILTEKNKSIYDNILHSFVGIAAVQIGLTDVLTAMDIIPDNIIGHSVGELGCAYADGCFTAEEMILAAYSRGLVSVETPFIKGSMAAVGLGYAAILPLCPPEIEVACHNSSESSTISGPIDIMKNFVVDLLNRGVFAKEVPCSNIAYHSRYIAEAGPVLLKYLSEVITKPKERSKKWLSTSVPQDKWDDPIAKYSSAEYHTNNLLNSVLFEETSKLIPSNALVIEIAPHGLLQAILKRSLSSCIHIPLTRRGYAHPIKYFLEAIGKLYETGLNPKVDILYPKIQYPVSTGTPLLSHLVEWEHSEEWLQAKYNPRDKIQTLERNFVMSLYDDDYKYFEGFVRNGKNVFPEAAYLILIWETLAMSKGLDYKDMSVIFRDVQFFGEVTIRKDEPLRLCVEINKGSYKFEISCDNTEIVSGKLDEVNSSDISLINLSEYSTDIDEVIISSKEIYKFLHYKGHSYRSSFQSIHSTNGNFHKAHIKWNNDWVSFLDGLLQFYALSRDFNEVSVPKFIQTIKICVNEQSKFKYVDNLQLFEAQRCDLTGVTRCGGVEIQNIRFTKEQQTDYSPFEIQYKSFIPHFFTGVVDISAVLQINLQLVAENISADPIKIVEICKNVDLGFVDKVNKVAGKIPRNTFQIDEVITENKDFDFANYTKLINTNLIILDDLLGNEMRMKSLYKSISKETFVLVIEQDTTVIHPKYKLFTIITAISVGKQILILLKKIESDKKVKSCQIITAAYGSFNWLPKIFCALKNSEHVLLVSERQSHCGLIGLVESLRKIYSNQIRLFVVDDYHAPSFNLENSIFKEQIQKNMTVNVLKQGHWGGYYYLPSSLTVKAKDCKLTCSSVGDLDCLNWTELDLKNCKDHLIQVYFAGPSKRDVYKAVGGKIKYKNGFGMDFSGLNCNEQRVMGLVSVGAISGAVNADPDLLWQVPNHWSLEDAATVPLPYAYAYYCLAIKSKIDKGWRIFISGGTGALSQAVINICLSLNCTVITTVSDEMKKKYLLKLFPKLIERNILCGRDATFCDQVINLTNNTRCDIVISNFTGPLREAAMQCVAIKGYFMDISSHDRYENKDFGMFYLSCERSYKNIKFSNIFKSENAMERKRIQLMLTEGITKGVVKPLTRIVLLPDNITRAFRLVSNSKHRGRIVIKIKDPASQFTTTPSVNYTSKGSYIILCDESDVGIELSDHLVRQGIRNLSIVMASDAHKQYVYMKAKSWKNNVTYLKFIFRSIDTVKDCADVLQETAMLGPIQGIYLVQTYNAKSAINNDRGDDIASIFNKITLKLANFDLISRKVCPELREFVVITNSPKNLRDTFAASASEKVCEARKEAGLPILYFRMECIDEFDDNLRKKDLSQNIKPQKMSSVLKALEMSLKLPYNNVNTFVLKSNTKKDHFIEKLSTILGLKYIDDILENRILNDFIINESTVEEVRNSIKEFYNISYTSKKILTMTIAGLKNLKHRIIVRKTNFHSGLGAFYTFVEDNECMGTEPVVAMRTKLNNPTEGEEILDRTTYLMVIPGFEGQHQMFQKICERLKVRAITFQLAPNLNEKSIQDMAANVFKIIKKRFEIKHKFYLMGYSFGVNIALELAAMFEKEGYLGVLYCLDSSPDALRIHLNSYLGNLTEEQLQNVIVEHMFKLMSGHQSSSLSAELRHIENWSEKVHLCVHKLRGLVNYSKEYQRSLLETAYKRIMWSKKYNSLFKLNSEIVLMKGISHPNAEELPHDYNLSKYTNQPVRIFNLEFDHALAPQDLRISNIINNFLDTSVIEEFKKKNLCEIFLADPVKIV